MKTVNAADEILQTAAELFMRQGYRKTSLSAIGERLGMTAAAIYYHFRSKEDLLFTYLDATMRQLMARSDAALAGLSAPRDRLEAFAFTYVSVQLELLERLLPASSMTYGFSHLMDELGAVNGRKMAKLFREYIETLSVIISDGVEQGDFTTTNVTASAFAVISLVEFAGLWFKPSETTISEAAALYASHAVNMLSGPRS